MAAHVRRLGKQGGEHNVGPEECVNFGSECKAYVAGGESAVASAQRPSPAATPTAAIAISEPLSDGQAPRRQP
jgi:hypothetical protein